MVSYVTHSYTINSDDLWRFYKNVEHGRMELERWGQHSVYYILFYK